MLTIKNTICFNVALLAATSLASSTRAQDTDKEVEEAAIAGRTLMQSQKWQDAEEKFAFVLEKNPDAKQAWYSMAYCKHNLGKFDEALKWYKKAFDVPQNRMLAKYNSGCIYARMERPDEAMKALSDAVSAGFSNHQHMGQDEDLVSLRDSDEFKKLIELAKANLEKANQNTLKVAILVHEGIELLDFAGPGEVFSMCRTADGKPAFQVWLVGPTEDSITSNGFAKVTPNYSVSNCPQPDIIVVPGGRTNRALNDDRIVDWIRDAGNESDVVMSVCTGAFLLAKAGHLDGKKATTHWGAISGLRNIGKDNFTVEENVRFIDSGKVITSAGVSAGIDAALHLVERLHGKDIAARTARYMEYDK